MKLEYFRQAEWEAKGLVHNEYMSSYQGKINAMPAAPAVTGEPGNNFANFGKLSITIAPCTNKLNDYLHLTVENIPDPLIWSNNLV
jgi:hypothetical protein